MTLVEGHEVEVGLHHRNEPSSMQKAVQTYGNTEYKQRPLGQAYITSHKSGKVG